jgi:hypothetical protein
MCRGFPYETGTTCKKEGKISVKRRILRSITLSRYNFLAANLQQSFLQSTTCCAKLMYNLQLLIRIMRRKWRIYDISDKMSLI